MESPSPGRFHRRSGAAHTPSSRVTEQPVQNLDASLQISKVLATSATTHMPSIICRRLCPKFLHTRTSGPSFRDLRRAGS